MVMPETSKAALFRIQALPTFAAPPGCSVVMARAPVLSMEISLPEVAEVVAESERIAVSRGFPA